jgi:hypothetical protein
MNGHHDIHSRRENSSPCGSLYDGTFRTRSSHEPAPSALLDCWDSSSGQEDVGSVPTLQKSTSDGDTTEDVTNDSGATGGLYTSIR